MNSFCEVFISVNTIYYSQTLPSSGSRSKSRNALLCSFMRSAVSMGMLYKNQKKAITEQTHQLANKQIMSSHVEE
jgi:glutaminase